MSISVLDCIQEIKRGSLLDGVGLWEGGRARGEGRSVAQLRAEKEGRPPAEKDRRKVGAHRF